MLTNIDNNRLNQNVFSQADYESFKAFMTMKNLFSQNQSVTTKPIRTKMANNPKSLLPQISIEDFYNEHLRDSQRDFSPKYCKSIETTFKHFKACFGEDRLIQTISLNDAKDFREYIMKCAQYGYPVYLRTIKAAFNSAVRSGYITVNPFALVRIKKVQKNRPEYLNEQQLNSILEKMNNQTIKNISTFGFFTGCRLNEIINLRWDNVDLVNKVITIGDSTFTTKTKRQRVIPINEKLFLILESLSKNKLEEFVFSKENGFPFTDGYVSKQFKKASRLAGMKEGIHFHSLRHSFGTNAANESGKIHAVKELMGHSSIKTTEIYMQSNLELNRRIVDLL